MYIHTMSNIIAEPVNPAKIKDRIFNRGTIDADDEAWRIARLIGALLRDKYGARNVLVFGSLAKKYWTKNSDIDIALSGIPARSFFRAIADVEALAGPFAVDIIDLDDCSGPERHEIEFHGVRL